MEEKWNVVEEFPTYKVSNFGEVFNTSNGKLMKPSTTQSGVVKVGMVSAGVQYTRSVKILVADAFVFGRTDIFNTPIHLDNDQRNNCAVNLMWRPRWFAWKYSRQFDDSYHNDRGPLVDLTTGTWYDTVLIAATTNGLLVKDILKAVATKTEVFPTWQSFSFR